MACSDGGAVMRRVQILACAVILALATSACGYSLAGRGSFLPAYIKAIGIPTFANQTRVFNLETQVTQKVRSEFISRGKYDVLPDVTGADAQLTGEILSMSLAPASFTAEQLATRYTITMTAHVELRDIKENKVLWENQALTFRQEYEAQNAVTVLDPAAFFSQDESALERMSTDFARTVVSAILEAF